MTTTNLIAPEQCIPFLALGISPDGKQLLSTTLLHVPPTRDTQTYLNSPCPHLACNLLGLGPVKGRPKRT